MIKTYHLRFVGDLFPYCGAGGDIGEDMLLDTWGQIPTNGRSCLRCAKRMHRVRINERIPYRLIPKVGIYSNG